MPTPTRPPPPAADWAAALVRGDGRWRRVAWHEASHAVASVRLGGAVAAVALTPGRADRLAGLCWVARPAGGPGPAADRARLVRLIVVLAGTVAERLVCPGAAPSLPDRRQADRLAAALTAARGLTPRHVLARAEGLAGRLVGRERRAVARVAAALLASDRLALSGPAVVALVGPAAG